MSEWQHWRKAIHQLSDPAVPQNIALLEPRRPALIQRHTSRGVWKIPLQQPDEPDPKHRTDVPGSGCATYLTFRGPLPSVMPNDKPLDIGCAFRRRKSPFQTGSFACSAFIAPEFRQMNVSSVLVLPFFCFGCSSTHRGKSKQKQKKMMMIREDMELCTAFGCTNEFGRSSIERVS